MIRTAFALIFFLSPLATAQDATFRNPLKRGAGADPWMTCHDGWYYLATTTGGDVRLRRARHLAEMIEATDQVVWQDSDPSRNRDVWAPEFHRLETANGPRWFLYYTASDGQEPHHRMYVAESSELMGPYSFKAKLLTDPDDRLYAIDGTVLKMASGNYFIWCGRPSPAGQGLYLSRMENPWTLTGPRMYLPADGFGCQHVREGPAALHHGDRTFLVYSACAADTPDYKLGMLSIDPKADPMNPKSWRQHSDPVFTRDDDAKVYGPGHNSFFQSLDGKEDWIAYHAKTGITRTYADRLARAQRFIWNPDGTPHFGKPLPLDADIREPSGETTAGK
jgi:GH43 family beta-xylosidase